MILKIVGNISKTILDILIEQEANISCPCGGRKSCGKCRIKVIQGKVKLLEKNYKVLTKEEIKSGICLACASYAQEDCIIEVLNTKDIEFEASEGFDENNIKVNNGIKLYCLEIDNDKLNKKSLMRYINYKLKKDFKISLKALRKLSTIIDENSKNQCSNSLYGEKNIELLVTENEIIDINMVGKSKLYGIAVDLGSTTIALSIVDLVTGHIIGSTSVLNSQAKFGADVLSRVQYSSEKNIEDVSKTVKLDILNGINALCINYNISKKDINTIGIAGNTIMLHLLMGLFSESLTMYPFMMVTNSEMCISFSELFESLDLSCDVYILPCISAYVGADVLCGIIQCGIHKSEHINLLLDIGTNSEIVIGNKEKLLCVTAAAGPAFEGANIECGIGSVKGAISSIKIHNGDIKYKTIKDGEPLGICGSGVVDIVEQALENNLIDSSGKINKDKINGESIYITKDIVFTQNDVREFQMAKSAIYSGIQIIMNKFGCSENQINKVFISGGFGNNLNIDSAIKSKIIPEEFKDKIVFSGNTSLWGVVNYILNIDMKKELNDVLKISKNLDIALDEEFNKMFINNINF